MAAPRVDPRHERPSGAGSRPGSVGGGPPRWGRRWWVVATLGATATALALGIPTDVIPNPVFGRPEPVTWWSVPVLVITSVLGGALLATYVREGTALDEPDRPGRAGGAAGLLAYLAIGCPVCNKLVVIALGTTGALEVFGPGAAPPRRRLGGAAGRRAPRSARRRAIVPRARTRTPISRPRSTG